MRKSAVAAFVTAAIGLAAASGALAAGVTAANAAGFQSVFIGGSSAAASGTITFIESTICGGAGNFSEWDTDTSVIGAPDFRAVSCKAAAGSPFLPGQNVTFYYRPEGGSVVGAYAIFNQTTINYLNLLSSDATYSTTVYADQNPSTAGCDPNLTAAAGKFVCNSLNSYVGVLSSTADGLASPFVGNVGGDDAWNTASKHANPFKQGKLDVGVTDAEPTAFGDPTSPTPGPGAGNNDPANYQGNVIYAPAFVGNTLTNDQLATMTASPIFQQTFGFVVNTTGAAAPADLPRAALAALFGGDPAIFTTIGGNSVPDWAKIALANGNKVVAAPTQAIICNREVGSGTRTTADIFLSMDGCDTLGGQAVLFDYVVNQTPGENPLGRGNNLATSLELDCVNQEPNSIGYVSVDNFSKLGAGKTYPNVKAITVNGITASNLNSATGQYEDNFEAWLTESTAASANGKAFYTAALTALQTAATTSQSAQITAIPGIVAGNTLAYPPAPVGATPIYVSDYRRFGNSCTMLQKQ